MLNQFYNSLPGRRFFILNTLLWLSFNTIAAYAVFQKQDKYEFWEMWRWFLASWGQWIWITPIIFAIIIMVPFKRKQWKPLIALNASLFLITITLNWFLAVLFTAMQEPEGLIKETFAHAFNFLLNGPFYLDLIIYFAVVAAAYIRAFDKHVRHEEIRNKELANQLLISELDTLKSQLNPHFLFNTLNCIASLIRQDNKPRALNGLNELSLMLRKVLENQNSQMIPLEQELTFIESYLTIQKMRFVNRLDTKINASEECLSIDFPFMLLQPLVENAIHHGVQADSNKSVVALNISKDGDLLKITLLNKVSPQTQPKGFGIGLSNTKKRLHWLYQDSFQLDMKEVEDGFFETFLCIPVGEND